MEQSLSISALDPSFYQDVEKLKDFADKAGSDGIITSGEKANIKLILMEITGDVLSGQTLPTLATIDTAKGGQVYLARAEARASGIPITHADYTAFETAYSDLKVYLESLTPRPWLTGDTTIDPVTWTAKWDAYYEKLSRLAVATSTYLANSIRPGEDYNGVTINTDKGIVVLRGDGLFRTILNATEGISIEKNNAGTWNKMFYTNLDGKIYAHGLVISSDSTIAGTDAATIKDNAAKGKAGIDELTSDLKVTPVEKAQLSREWEAIKAEYTQVLAQATALGVTTSTYTTSYTNLDGVTPKIAAEVLATMTTTYTFASASARDAFRTKINSYFTESEKIKKAINDAINKSASDANSKVNNIKIGGRTYLRNGDFTDYYTSGAIGWDYGLNGNLVPRFWSTFNGGVADPTKGYHANINTSVFNYPVLSFINRNSTIGQKNRWMGSSSPVSEEFHRQNIAGKEITISMDIYSDTKDFRISGGLYHFITGDTNNTFHSGKYVFSVSNVNVWERFTFTMKLSDKYDTSKPAQFYIYGGEGIEGSGYVRNVKLELGNQATPFSKAQEDIDEVINNSLSQTANVIMNSGFANDTKYWVFNPTGTTIDDSVMFEGVRSAKILQSGLASNSWRGITTEQYDCAINQPITISAYSYRPEGGAVLDAGAAIEVQTFDKNYNRLPETYATGAVPSKTNTWERFSLTFKPTNPLIKYVKFFAYVTKNGLIHFAKPMMQYGSVVGVWSPNPSDLIIGNMDKVVQDSKNSIADMTSDMKITPLEKQTLSRDWESIKAEYPQVLALAQSTSGVSTTAYTTAYTNLDGVSPKIASEVLANMNTTYAFASPAARDLFKTQMNTYFNESEKIKKAINDAINNSANNANNKIDNLKIGSRNIVRKKQLTPINTASPSYDEATNTWTLTVNVGAGGAWGGGLRITDKFSVIPIGSWYTTSFEVYSPVDITWNNDTNNFPIDTSSGTNDNDEVALRKNSDRNIKANKWTKCWFSYKNKDSSTTELYDQSNIGIVNNTSAPITFKIRNVKGELGSIPTDFTFAPEDIDESIAKVQDNLDKLSVGGKNLILESNIDYSTTDYLIKMYSLSEDWIVGQEYTFVIKGTIPAGQKFGIWQNGGSNKVGEATTTYVNGVTYVTFKAIATTTGNERKLSLYNFPQNTTLSTVDWVALYKGNKPMDWSPAPEDFEKLVADMQIGGNNIIPNSLFRTKGSWRDWGISAGTRTVGVSVDLAGFGTGFQFSTTAAGEFGYALDGVSITQGETYTLSAWFKLDTAGDVKVQEGDSTVKWTYTKGTAPIGKWFRIVHTFVAKGSSTSIYAGQDGGSGPTAGYVTGIQLERGNKVTDWSLSTQDLNDLINATNQRVDNIKVGGTQMLTGTDFKDASGWNRWGSIGSIGHYAQPLLPTGKALYMETRNGTTQLPTPIDSKIGMASDGRKFAVKNGREYTLSMNVATSELGDTLDYMYLMYTVAGGNRRLADIKTTNFPKFAPIAEGSLTNYYSVKLTFTADRDDDNAYILIGGGTKRALDGTNGYAWIRVNSLKIEEGNVATSWELAPADIDKAIADADKKAQDAANNANNALKQGQVVVNSTFSNWTQAFPAGLGSWTGSTVSKETTLTRTGSAMRFDVPTDTAQIGAQITTGYFIPNLPNNKYYALELDFMLVSGSITGACVLLDWNSMSPSRASIHLSDVVPAPTLGKWYTVRAVMKRPTDNLTGYSAMAGYLLANYSGSTTNKVKNIIFDRLVFREPTQQEIDAYEITTIENGVTVIDGGKLKTNSVKAESVDARRLRVTNNSGTVTLEITDAGEVTVNGKVSINSSSMFAPGYDPSKNDGGRNILLNSRFATADATNWTNWGSPSVRQVEDITDLPGFDKAVKFTTTANNQGLNQTVSVVNGNTYTLSCYAKSSSGQPVLQVYDGVGYPSVVMNSADVGKNKWVKMYFVFTAKASTVRLDMGKSAGGTLGTYWFTGIKLEEGDKTTGWTPAGEDVDGLIGKVVTPNGDIKSLDIASSMAITPGAIDVVSKNINLKGKVTFSDFASGWALDSKGNKISNSDQPGYDPAKPLYLDMDGNYRPLSDEKNFMSNLFSKDDTTGVTVIDGNYIKTGTIQAKNANFRDVQVYNDAGQQTFRIDTNGNLSTSGTSQSIGYERQKKGWKIDADGSAEFNAATFRGDIELGYYNAPTDAFVVTGGLLSGVGGTGKDLRFWAGSNKSTAPFKVFSDGTLEATKGFFTGTFSGEVVVGNILIKDTATKGDAKIILTDDSKIQKVVLGESAVELNTKTTFGNFLTVDITNQKLDFGANDFGIDYKNNTIRMKSFSIKGTTALEFVSDGSSGDDFVFKNVTGDTSVRVDGSFIARDDIEITNVLRMKKSVDAGNKGIDYVFI
nr:carbohydrate binding domain-containing protein [Bacillus cereus]